MAVLLLLPWPSLQAAETSDRGLPKNIILFIGDGMGTPHITAARTVNGRLHLERFNTSGLLLTHSANAFATESAAAATALATGKKTNNTMVALSPQGRQLKTVVEIAQERGMGTGLITTSRITHATPACFGSHVAHRDNENLIAEQLAFSNIDVLMGGGLDFFLPRSANHSKRKDNKNLLDALQKRYTVVTQASQFKRIKSAERLVALLAMQHLPAAQERQISLTQMTRMGLAILEKKPKGFFLMVEGAQIDWGGHEKDSNRIIQETIDFDNAIGSALAFAETRQDTLIIVTADHESGGYTLIDGSVTERIISKTAFATSHHSGEMVPVFAYGPGSQVIGGIHDNTFVGQTMINYLQGRNK